MADTNERFMILAEALSRIAKIVEDMPMQGYQQNELGFIRMDIDNLIRGIEEERANAAKVEE